VLPAAAQRSVPAAGPAIRVTLAPLSSRTGTRAVRLTDAAGGTWWLELRTPSGRDSWLGTADDRFALDAGVLLHRTGRMPDTALLLDGTPVAPPPRGTTTCRPRCRSACRSPVAGGAFTVTVDAVAGDGAALTVTPTPMAAVPVTPLPEGGAAPEVLAAAPAPARSAEPAPQAAAVPPRAVPAAAAETLPAVSPDAALPAADDRLVLSEPVPVAVESASGTPWPGRPRPPPRWPRWRSPAGPSPASVDRAPATEATAPDRSSPAGRVPMHNGVPLPGVAVVSRPSRPSLLRSSVLGLAAAVAVPVLVVAPTARAEDPPVTEETVVGELVQGYADPAPQEHLEEGHADGDALLSWVRTAPGEAVRVPTADVADIEVGATVEVTLG
jgi:hypothetical protein